MRITSLQGSSAPSWAAARRTAAAPSPAVPGTAPGSNLFVYTRDEMNLSATKAIPFTEMMKSIRRWMDRAAAAA